MTKWHVFQASLELIRQLRQVVAAVAKRDRELAGQLRRAASSVPLNLAEGSRREGGDQAYHYRVAAGSAREVQSGLLVAEAWGYLEPAALNGPLVLTDRILAMTYRLTH